MFLKILVYKKYFFVLKLKFSYIYFCFKRGKFRTSKKGDFNFEVDILQNANNTSNTSNCWPFNHFKHSRRGVPNLGYVDPQGYVKHFKGYDSCRITLRFSKKMLTRGHAGFMFFCMGLRIQKKVGNRCSRTRKLLRKKTSSPTKNVKVTKVCFLFHGINLKGFLF